MNTNQIINLSVLIVLITIIIITININKLIKNRLHNSIKNKLNNPYSPDDIIKLSYEIETGNYPFDTNKKDGTLLEYEVFKTLYSQGGKVLSNLFLNEGSSNINEIDHVLVHNTGIYVIECKDTNALSIIGDEKNKNWIYKFKDDFEEDRYSPLKQNLGHINFLKRMLHNKYPSEFYISLVVINCEDMNITFESNGSNYYQSIITPCKLSSHIKSLINQREKILTEEEIIDIYKYLHENYANVSKEIRNQHMINIQNIINDNNPI